MTEGSKKTPGRPQVYNGEISDLAKKMEDRRRAERAKKAVPERQESAEQKEPSERQKLTEQQRLSEQQEPKLKQKSAEQKEPEEQPSLAKRDTEQSGPARKRVFRVVKSVVGGNAESDGSQIAKRQREQDNERKIRTLCVILGVLIAALIAALIYEVGFGHGTKQTRNEQVAEQQESERRAALESERAQRKAQKEAEAAAKVNGDAQDASEGNAAVPELSLLEQAQLMAAQYDYDGAIDLLKSSEEYEGNAEFAAAVSDFERSRDACVPYPASEVTHIFFHTLIHDPAKAFDGDEDEIGYNQNMVTESEFNSIIQQMYDRGYVMIFLDEIVKKTEDSNGNPVFAEQDILLPPDKIPFVLSQDDANYYHYMDGDGFASRLIVDENGDVKNEYIEDDGSVSVGDYDLVPLIDRFVEQHPDFSYHGQKGYIALTGYEGILGYRTDEVYKTKQQDRVTSFQQQFFDSYPGGFDEAAFERECEEAKKVAEAMKADGWKFASHTWGHQNLHETNGIAYDKFVLDTDRWEEWVEPLIGETDTLIYAFGGDIRGAEPYAGDRFEYLKKCGFDYFCGVDSSKHWLQVGTDYVRQSRRNIDGYRMYYNPDMLSDLFDASAVWDPLRPESVPQI